MLCLPALKAFTVIISYDSLGQTPICVYDIATLNEELEHLKQCWRSANKSHHSIELPWKAGPSLGTRLHAMASHSVLKNKEKYMYSVFMGVQWGRVLDALHQPTRRLKHLSSSCKNSCGFFMLNKKVINPLRYVTSAWHCSSYKCTHYVSTKLKFTVYYAIIPLFHNPTNTSMDKQGKIDAPDHLQPQNMATCHICPYIVSDIPGIPRIPVVNN